MFGITELVDLTDILDPSQWISELEHYLQMNHIPPQDLAVRVGFEFCERRINTLDISILKNSLKSLHVRRSCIIFVLPSPHEIMLEHLTALVKMLRQEQLVDAWVINDIGMISFLEQFDDTHLPVILGRLFDKQLHETRWAQLQELQSGYYVNRYEPSFVTEELIRQGEIAGVELDYVPGTILDLSACSNRICCFVHIDRMFVGCTAHCIFGVRQGVSLNRPLDSSPCENHCMQYTRKYHRPSFPPIYQIGNALYALHRDNGSASVVGSYIPVSCTLRLKGSD